MRTLDQIIEVALSDYSKPLELTREEVSHYLFNDKCDKGTLDRWVGRLYSFGRVVHLAN